jgi:uncharacterized membrane protein required for colicin V production
MTSLDQHRRHGQSPGRVIVVFMALTAAAVALALIAAYWRHDGAEALGYLGGGMFGAALTFLLLSSAQSGGPSRPHP